MNLEVGMKRRKNRNIIWKGLSFPLLKGIFMTKPCEYLFEKLTNETTTDCSSSQLTPCMIIKDTSTKINDNNDNNNSNNNSNKNSKQVWERDIEDYCIAVKKSYNDFTLNSNLIINILNTSDIDSIPRLNLALANSRLDLMTDDTEHPGDGDCFFYAVAIVDNFNKTGSRFLGKGNFEALLEATKELKKPIIDFLTGSSTEYNSFVNDLKVKFSNNDKSRSIKSMTTKLVNKQLGMMLERLKFKHSKNSLYPYIDNVGYYQDALYIVLDMKVIIYRLSADQTIIESISGGETEGNLKSVTINVLLTNSDSQDACHYLPLFPTKKF